MWFLYALCFIFFIILLSSFVLPKLTWILEGRMYILNLIDSYVENKMEKNLEKILKKIDKLNISEQRLKESKELSVKLMSYEIIKRLRFKNSFIVLINPFTNNITHLVRNKEVLISLLDQDK